VVGRYGGHAGLDDIDRNHKEILNLSLTLPVPNSITDDSQRDQAMSEAAVWDQLTRFEQRALIKLFGGGSLRKNHPAVAEELRARGLVDENNALAMPGLFVLTLAMRRQRVDAQSRTGIAA
jgi:hypothetical protein